MRLDLVGPAPEPSAEAPAGGGAPGLAPRWEPVALPAERAPPAASSADSLTTAAVAQPDITPRSGWEADESLREQTEPDYGPQAPKV
jgi:hypothetical protein